MSGPNRPNVSGDIKINGGAGRRTSIRRPIGAPNSPYTRPAPGTFGNMERNSLRGPGYRRTDASHLQEREDRARRETSSSGSRP